MKSAPAEGYEEQLRREGAMSFRNEKTLKAAAGFGNKSELVSLNIKQRCDEASEFEQELFHRIVAQDDFAPLY